MIRIIESNGRTSDPDVLAFMRLRKRRFHDDLAWDVLVEGDCERDAYDDIACTYVLDLRPEGLAGGMRLMPTTGRTLMHDVFGSLMPDPMMFRASETWEITRFCLSPDIPKVAFSTPRRLFSGLMAFSRARSIERYVAVTDDVTLKLMRWVGLPAVPVGRSEDGFGCPVTAWSWDVDAEFEKRMNKERALYSIAAEVVFDRPNEASEVAKPAASNVNGSDAGSGDVGQVSREQAGRG